MRALERVGTKQVYLLAILAVFLILLFIVFASTTAQNNLTGQIISNPQEEQTLPIFSYTDNIDLEVKEPQEYEWRPNSFCDSTICNLRGIKISGEITFTKSGSAGFYLEDAGIRYLIFKKEFQLENSLIPEAAEEILEPQVESSGITNETNGENETVEGELNITQGPSIEEYESVSEFSETFYFTDSCEEACNINHVLSSSSLKLVFNLTQNVSVRIYNISYDLQPENLTIYSLGGKEYIELEGAEIYPGEGSFSVEAWIKTSDLKDAVIVSTGECCWIEEYWALAKAKSGDKALFQIKLNDGTGEISGAGARNLADGNWHHVVFVRDRENGIVRGYIDGSLDLEFGDATGEISDASERLIIGNGNIYQNEWFNGSVSKVKTYRRALIEEEIVNSYSTDIKKLEAVRE